MRSRNYLNDDGILVLSLDRSTNTKRRKSQKRKLNLIIPKRLVLYTVLGFFVIPLSLGIVYMLFSASQRSLRSKTSQPKHTFRYRSQGVDWMDQNLPQDSYNASESLIHNATGNTHEDSMRLDGTAEADEEMVDPGHPVVGEPVRPEEEVANDLERY